MDTVMVLFTGPKGVGKTLLVRSCARILSNDNKKVAIIDAAEDRGLNYCLCLGAEEEDLNALKALEALNDPNKEPESVEIGKNIDLFTSTRFVDVDYAKVFKNLSLLKGYDCVLIDADINNAIHGVEVADRIFLVQNLARENAIETQQKFLLPAVSILGEESLNKKCLIIYNQDMESKMKIEEIEKYLTFAEKDGKVIPLLLKADDTSILFDEENQRIDIDMRANGIIKTRAFTKEFRKALFKLSSMITNLSGKWAKIA